MAESISLDVRGKVPEELLSRLYGEITPEYVRDLLAQNGMPTDEKTIDDVTTSYEAGFPTRDLALKAITVEDGMKFWGIASGYDNSRQEKISVKYLILEHIQNELASIGIQSELNIADLYPETVDYMRQKRLFKEKLPELMSIAKQRGNMDNILLGTVAVLHTPVSVEKNSS